MNPTLRRAAAALVAALVTGAIVALSRAPYGRADDAALLRLSWSGRPARIERCRELSDAELAKRPAHMRQRVECEGRSARYVVRVLDGGVALSSDSVAGGGLRGDRAIHMLREYRLAPGVHALAVVVARTDSVPDEEAEAPEPGEAPEPAAPLDRATRERDERRRQREERLPPLLRLDTTVTLPAGQVFLVTYDASDRRLVGVSGPADESP